MHIIASLLLSATTVFRLELTDEIPYIVGADGERRQVVIVSPDEYRALTNNVIETWRRLHGTEEGRAKIHGRRVNTSVAGNVRIDTYEDGWRKPWPMSRRQEDHMRLRARLAKRKPKEITVEHDATTGKDNVQR